VAATARNTTYYHHLLFLANPTENSFLVSVDLNESLPVFEKGLLNSSVKKFFHAKKAKSIYLHEK